MGETAPMSIGTRRGKCRSRCRRLDGCQSRALERRPSGIIARERIEPYRSPECLTPFGRRSGKGRASCRPPPGDQRASPRCRCRSTWLPASRHGPNLCQRCRRPRRLRTASRNPVMGRRSLEHAIANSARQRGSAVIPAMWQQAITRVDQVGGSRVEAHDRQGRSEIAIWRWVEGFPSWIAPISPTGQAASLAVRQPRLRSPRRRPGSPEGLAW
jgi:hypothetical protein